MTELERFVAEKIVTLVPRYDQIDLTAVVDAFSFSVEFFVTLDGGRMQCFDMVDAGMFSEKMFNTVSRDIAVFCRKHPDFLEGKLNKYTLTLTGTLI